VIIRLNTDRHCKIKCDRKDHSYITNLTVQDRINYIITGQKNAWGKGKGERGGGDADAWKTAATVVRYILTFALLRQLVSLKEMNFSRASKFVKKEHSQK
jgi:hypothetical protein